MYSIRRRAAGAGWLPSAVPSGAALRCGELVALSSPERRMPTFTEEILLLLGDEAGVFLPIQKHAFECALAGAVLMDLAFAYRIDTDLQVLVVTGATPTGNAVLDASWTRSECRPRRSPAGSIRSPSPRAALVRRVPAAMERISASGAQPLGTRYRRDHDEATDGPKRRFASVAALPHRPRFRV